MTTSEESQARYLLDRIGMRGDRNRGRRGLVLRIAEKFHNSAEVQMAAVYAMYYIGGDNPFAEDICQLCKRAIDIEPANVDALQMHAFACHVLRRYGMAEILLHQALSIAPNSAVVTLLAEVLACDGRKTGALRILELYCGCDDGSFADCRGRIESGLWDPN